MSGTEEPPAAGAAPAVAVADLAAALAGALADASGPVFVGFSGGLDSTVLLHAAALAVAAGVANADANANPKAEAEANADANAGPGWEASSWAWRQHAVSVVAVHVNHALQPGSDAWQDHCARVATALGVGFVARRVRVEPRGSLEAAARSARYAVFADCLAAPGSRLLLAHHRDDQAETILLRLLQGRGLYGMPAARGLAAGMLLRPLLGLSRVELEHYARAYGLDWLEDPSNDDLSIDRNYVRHRVMPGLKARFPAVESALVAANVARAAEDALLLDEFPAPLAQASVPIADLLARNPAQRRTWLRLWLTAHGRAIPPARALDVLLDQLGAAPDRQPRLALDRGQLRRHGGRLWLLEPEPELAARYSFPIPGQLRLPHGVVVVTADPAGFACRGSLEVRFRAGGERIRSGGHQRQVKQLLHARGVPPWLRPAYPLLFDDDGLAAVPGIARRDADTAADLPRYRAEWLSRS